MSPTDVNELVEYGALSPLELKGQERLFSAQCITQLRTASKLRLDFDLDLFFVALLLGYLNRIEALEQQVRMLKAQVSTRATTDSHVGPHTRHEHPA